MGRDFKSVPAIAGCMLIVILAVLCLTVFSMLSLSTQQSNGALSDEAALSVINYYKADSEAEEILSRLRNGEMVDGVKEENGLFYYSCNIDKRQKIDVIVRIYDKNYDIIKWQAVSTALWQANDELNVYK